MKKILTTITLSALIGTSASNLKPVFMSNVVNHGFQSNQINNKNISIKNENSSNPFINAVINDIKTKIVKISPNGTIWVGTEKGLYKSTDGITFEQVTGFNYEIYDIAFSPDGTVWISVSGIYKSTDGTNFTKIGNFGHEGIFSIDVAKDGTVYFGTKGGLLKPGKLYKIDIINSLLTINKADYIGDKYNGFVYKNEQKIGIKKDYLDRATLDGKSITIPTTDLDIPVGEHTLILTLKDKYKLFSGNKTGIISFKFLIKI